MVRKATQLVTVELVMKRLNKRALRATQKGVVLVLMAVILVLAASAIALKIFDTSALKARQDSEASILLADAKVALIGYSLGRVGAGERPGNMPYPDRLLSPIETPPAGGSPNYDGQTDSCSGVGATMVCLGRLPWQTIGMAIANPTQNDVLGTMPWYAVSANLTDPTCMSVINPSILNMTYIGYVCGSITNLPHPWIVVRDSKGNIISSRVAIVLIIPRQPLGNQTRLSSPLGDATNYLDTVVVPASCIAPCVPGTYSNSDLDNDFILASGLTGANSDQNNQNLATTINDKILFITIDELIAELTKRAAGEARTLLNDYKANNKGSLPSTRFPYAAPLGAALNNNISNASSNGSLPIDVTDTCSCTSGASCTCNFQAITNVAFKRGSGTAWTANTPNCTYTGATCTCVGAGSCTRGARSFSCSSSGLCTHNVTGVNTYTYIVPNHADIVSVTNGCAANSGKVVCNAAGSFDVGLKEPTWFKANLWQDYFYYRWILPPPPPPPPPAYLQVGTRTNVEALLIGTGSPVVVAPFASKGSAQTRPSGLISDYLDSVENTDGNLVFDDTTMPRSASYNDQTFVVYP